MSLSVVTSLSDPNCISWTERGGGRAGGGGGGKEAAYRYIKSCITYQPPPGEIHFLTELLIWSSKKKEKLLYFFSFVGLFHSCKIGIKHLSCLIQQWRPGNRWLSCITLKLLGLLSVRMMYWMVTGNGPLYSASECVDCVTGSRCGRGSGGVWRDATAPERF